MPQPYLDFIKTLPTQDDHSTNKLIDLIKKDPDFPKTSDIIKLARYLYLKLDPELTRAFQKSLMLKIFLENNEQVPQDPEVLNQINFIVQLQNQDPEYPFKW